MTTSRALRAGSYRKHQLGNLGCHLRAWLRHLRCQFGSLDTLAPPSLTSSRTFTSDSGVVRCGLFVYDAVGKIEVELSTQARSAETSRRFLRFRAKGPRG